MRCCRPPSEAIYGAEASVAPRNDALLSIVRGWPEIERLRLAVVATNSEVAEPFWRALGYQAVGAPVPYTYDNWRPPHNASNGPCGSQRSLIDSSASSLSAAIRTFG